MDPVRQALYTLMAADGPLTGLLSTTQAIYHRQAKQGAEPPYIIFQRQSGTDIYTLGTDRLENDVWLVKAVDLADSATRAEDIADRVAVVLHDTELNVPGRDTLWVRRESRVDYSESTGADLWQHCGGVFRLVTAT